MTEKKYDIAGLLVHPTKNPPWSQAICEKCYLKRFKVRGTCHGIPRHGTEPCIDCGQESLVTLGSGKKGCLYFDARPPSKNRKVFGPAFQRARDEWNVMVESELDQ